MRKMTPRENLLHLLRREGYETVPVEFMLCPSLEKSFQEEIGGPGSDYMDYFEMPWRRVGDLIPEDTDVTRFYPYYDEVKDNMEIDEWGVGHESSPTSMHMTKMLHPLEDAEDVEEIESYPIPVYTEEKNAWVKDRVKGLHERGLASVGNMQCTIWETSWYIRGMENLMMDMLSDEEMAEAVFDMVEKMSTDRALIYAKAGVDILYLGDDIGMQHSIMMSEEMYTQWICPRLKRLISKVKAVRPDIIVIYHSCGAVFDAIPELIEVGADLVHPIQAAAVGMEPERLKTAYGDQVAFCGGVDIQHLLPCGPPDQVREKVRELRALFPTGLVISPSQGVILDDVPPENVKAMVDEAIRM